MAKPLFEIWGMNCLYDHSVIKHETWSKEASVFAKALVEYKDGFYSVSYSRWLDERYDNQAILKFLLEQHPEMIPHEEKRSRLDQAEAGTLLKELFDWSTRSWVVLPSSELKFPETDCCFRDEKSVTYFKSMDEIPLLISEIDRRLVEVRSS